MTLDHEDGGGTRLRRKRRPMPPGRLAALFAVFVALLVYQRDFVTLALAGLGLILYGMVTRPRD